MTEDRVIEHYCGTKVLQVVVERFGLVSLELEPLHVTEPVDGYERFLGQWHSVHHSIGNKHRGYQIHRPHKCPETVTTQGEGNGQLSLG